MVRSRLCGINELLFQLLIDECLPLGVNVLNGSGLVQDRLLRVISPKSSLPDGVMKYISGMGKTLTNWPGWAYSSGYV